MTSIREKPHGRKRLNVWVPLPVHDALTVWLNERDLTIQGTVRRLLEAEIEYGGPPLTDERVRSAIPAAATQHANAYPMTQQRKSLAPSVQQLPKTMTAEEADAQYLANRRKGWEPGKSRRVVSNTPPGWEAPEPTTGRRIHPLWNEEEQFVNWYCRGESVQSSKDRVTEDPDWIPPEIKPEWEAARLAMAGDEESI